MSESTISGGLKVVEEAQAERDDIMSSISDQMSGQADIDAGIMVNIGGKDVNITSGAGALLLDDKLSELSTLEQNATSLVAAENKAEKAISNTMKQ